MKHYIVYEQDYDYVYFISVKHSLKECIEQIKTFKNWNCGIYNVTCPETQEQWYPTIKYDWTYKDERENIYKIKLSDEEILNYDN